VRRIGKAEEVLKSTSQILKILHNSPKNFADPCNNNGIWQAA